MIKLKEILTEAEVSKELWYHVNNNISLEECVFRYGSPKYFTLINEARTLAYEEGIEFDNQTRALLETDLGKFGMYRGEEVALDFPLINQDFLFEAQNLLLRQSKLSSSEYQKAKKLKGFNKDNYKWDADKDLYVKSIDEAKKDPPIGKPKRGGPKAYYVYVRDPKTKRIKKVTFGSGGLRAKINNPKARRAFAARHRCSTATDRTTARYWSCRLPRYAKQLGLAVKNPGGFW